MVDEIQRKQLEQERAHSQKMEAVGQLIGGVAHDFNNLPQVISSNLHFLKEDLGDNGEHADMLRVALGAADRGAGITHGLLAFAHQGMLAPKETNVGILLTDAVSLLRPMLGETIEITAIVETPATQALVDQSHLQTAPINLAINARDAMPEGGKLVFELAQTEAVRKVFDRHDESAGTSGNG